MNSFFREKATKFSEKNETDPGVFIMLGCGVVSSTTALLLISPLNVMRVRLQANGILPQEERFKGFKDVFKKILIGDGIKGFYRGIVPTMVKVIPATSISYAAYGKLQSLF